MQLRAHENPVQNFWVVSGGQCARLLHVTSKIPKLFQANLGNIDYVVGLIDRCFRIRSPRHRRAQRHNKAGKILVESKKSKLW